MNNLEYIDDYFTGRLTGEEKTAFEARVHTDPAFSEELAFYVSAMDLFKQELNEEKKARFKDLYQQQKGQSLHAPVRRLWPYAVAASLLIAIAGIWWISSRPPKTERLADRYINGNLQILPVKMSTVHDSLQKAADLYNAGHLPEALEQFRQIPDSSPLSVQAKINAGIVYLRLQEYDSALVYFRRSKTDTVYYSNPGQFYESLTLMKRHRPGDTEQARLLLQQIVDQDMVKKQDALRLLENW